MKLKLQDGGPYGNTLEGMAMKLCGREALADMKLYRKLQI